jgi:hypothetical protein
VNLPPLGAAGQLCRFVQDNAAGPSLTYPKKLRD